MKQICNAYAVKEGNATIPDEIRATEPCQECVAADMNETLLVLYDCQKKCSFLQENLFGCDPMDTSEALPLNLVHAAGMSLENARIVRGMIERIMLALFGTRGAERGEK